MLLNITDLSGDPLHCQISRQLATKILSGDLLQGAELKPAHAFAREQRVSLSTVVRAYNELAKDGLITYAGGARILVNTIRPAKMKSPALQGVPADAIEGYDIGNELATAQEIQTSLLPKSLPNNSRFQLAAYTKSSRPIGGDFYDYLPIDENRFGLIIADVCGKGLPAAMLVSQIQAIVKNEIHHRSSIRQTMHTLNQHVRRYGTARRFVTMFYGMFDDHTEMLEFANAGHNLPILVRRDGRVEFLKTTGPALNILANFEYQVQTVRIACGDTVLFFTDGVTETMNGACEEFGERRLAELFSRYRHRSAQDILRIIIDELSLFQASTKSQDDRTMMIFKR